VLAELAHLVAAGGVTVLSGAGLSTESGIPDYRGPSGSLRRHQPMTYQAFVGDPVARQRYWARSYLGWRRIAAAVPNDGHRVVAQLQRYGLVATVITQNVDGLHQAAGAHDVVELHGGLDRAVCLSCGGPEHRVDLDRRLRLAKPGFGSVAGAVNPDGDVELPDAQLAGFRMVECLGCGGGPLKPDVVFFGENVPKPRVERCYGAVEASRALLVLGSSLSVLSGYRFVRHASRHGVPVAIVNRGATRGDELADVRVDAPLGRSLRALAAALGATDPSTEPPDRSAGPAAALSLPQSRV
jgi:NAD-dependent SIR2 family protein deacetylase